MQLQLYQSRPPGRQQMPSWRCCGGPAQGVVGTAVRGEAQTDSAPRLSARRNGSRAVKVMRAPGSPRDST